MPKYWWKYRCSRKCNGEKMSNGSCPPGQCIGSYGQHEWINLGRRAIQCKLCKKIELID
jgi:hypothetical protein